MQLGPGAKPLLTLGVPPSGGAGSYRKLTFLCEHLAWRGGTPASHAHPDSGSWVRGNSGIVLTPSVLPPLCLGPPAPIPCPWQAPTSYSRARGASVGAPHGAASPPPRRARPAQSALPAHPQRSPAPRGAGAGEQHGLSPAGARSRPMVPGVPEPRSPLPRSFSASTEKEEARKGREKER